MNPGVDGTTKSYYQVLKPNAIYPDGCFRPVIPLFPFSPFQIMNVYPTPFPFLYFGNRHFFFSFFFYFTGAHRVRIFAPRCVMPGISPIDDLDYLGVEICSFLSYLKFNAQMD